MFYIKNEITEGITIRTEITDENVFTTCPNCGAEHRIDLQDAIVDGQLDLYGMTICCEECSAKRLRQREQSGMRQLNLDSWVPDDTDRLGVARELWFDYSNLIQGMCNAGQAASQDERALRDVLDRVMEGSLSDCKDEIQAQFIWNWSNWGEDVMDAAAGNPERIALYRRVLGLAEGV